MNRTILTQFVIGIVLAAVGITLFVIQKDDIKVSAASYSSNWRATKLIKVDVSWDNATVHRGPAIGVAEWRVTGDVNGRGYSEIWTIPAVTGLNYNASGNTCTTTLGVNASKWLYGCAVSNSGLGSPNVSRYSFSVVDSATFNTASVDSWTGNLDSNGMDADGTAAGCWRSPNNSGEPDCLVTTGAYSFQHHYFPGWGGDNDRDRITGFGTLMPLEWQVAGTF